MYTYNGQEIKPNKSWTDDNGVTHPRNWAECWSSDEIAAKGVVYTPDQEPPTPTLDELKAIKVAGIKAQANFRLSQTDWKIIRAMEMPAKPPSQEITQHRIDIRNKSGEHEAAIVACTTVKELEALQFDWPEEP